MNFRVLYQLSVCVVSYGLGNDHNSSTDRSERESKKKNYQQHVLYSNKLNEKLFWVQMEIRKDEFVTDWSVAAAVISKKEK